MQEIVKNKCNKIKKGDRQYKCRKKQCRRKTVEKAEKKQNVKISEKI